MVAYPPRHVSGMTGNRPRIALALVFLAAACGGDAASPIDAGPSSTDLTCHPDDRRAFESRASFSNGCNCCVCWEGQAVCEGDEGTGVALWPSTRAPLAVVCDPTRRWLLP